MITKKRVACLAVASLGVLGCSGGGSSGGGSSGGAGASSIPGATAPPARTPPATSGPAAPATPKGTTPPPPASTPPGPAPAPRPTPQPSPAPAPAPGPPVLGLDVSEFQGTIDWQKVANAGYGFAIARVSDGFYHDPEFARNWSEMKARGLVRGAYQFFRGSQDGTQQADDFLAQLGTLDATDLPPFCDVEVLDGVSAAQLAAQVHAWVVEIEKKTGRVPLIYTSPGFWDGNGYTDTFGCDLWVAHWFVSAPTIPGGWSDWSFWQTSDNGTIPGINGAVDEDRFHGSLAQLQAYVATGKPAPTPTPSPATTYTVQSGDTLSAIAARFGVTLAALEAANPQITNPNVIYVGQVITIPGSAPASPAVADADKALTFAASNPVNPNTGTRDWYLWCLALVNNAWISAGHPDAEFAVGTARESYDAFAKTAVIHDMDKEPPPRGAVLYWDWYSGGVDYGHTAIANGDGTCATTVAPGTGTGGGSIDVRCPLSAFSSLPKLGWVDPVTRR